MMFRSKSGTMFASLSTWSSNCRCCAVAQTVTATFFSAFSRLMTGKSLMASGRVPKRTRKCFCTLQPSPWLELGGLPCPTVGGREGFAEKGPELEFRQTAYLSLRIATTSAPVPGRRGKAIQAQAAAFGQGPAEFDRRERLTLPQLP